MSQLDNKGPNIHGVASWTGELPLKCIAVGIETADVKSFFFRAEAQQFSYRPGQFITLELMINDARVCRCYTLSSSPCRPYVASITVKRQPGGLVSNYLHDNMKPSMEINALAPGGDFSYVSQQESDKYLFLSGGSGITPLMSMSRYMYDLRAEHDIVFLHSARSPADIIFHNELKTLAWSLPSFRISLFCDTQGDSKDWSGHLGYLTEESLSAAVPDILERTIFCCGPPIYMQNIRSILSKIGFDMKNYYEESFDFATQSKKTFIASPEIGAGVEAKAQETNVAGETATQPPVATSLPAREEKHYKVHFKDLNKNIECSSYSTILEAAREQGIQRPFMCSQGICGTCKSKLIEGKVDMQHNGGIRESEISAGYFLPCCSFPLTDINME